MERDLRTLWDWEHLLTWQCVVPQASYTSTTTLASCDKLKFDFQNISQRDKISKFSLRLCNGGWLPRQAELNPTECSGVTLSRQCMYWPCQQVPLWWSGNVCAWLCRQAELNPVPLACQARTLPLHQRGNPTGEASIYTTCSVSLCYILPCQISACPWTLAAVITIRVLTTTQLLYYIESPHCEDSHSFFHPSLFGLVSCHSHHGLYNKVLAVIWPQYHTCTKCSPLWPQFHTCIDITALWWSHFGRHCNSGWLHQQVELNPRPLACHRHTSPLHQRGNVVGKTST